MNLYTIVLSVFVYVLFPNKTYARIDSNNTFGIIPGYSQKTAEPIQENTSSVTKQIIEDKRAAATIAATLSGHVMTSALAVLAGIITFSFFLLDRDKNRSISIVRYYACGLFILLSVFLLVGSIIYGGRGIDELYKSGFKGNWIVSPGNSFNNQATWCLLGMISAILAVFIRGLTFISSERNLNKHQSIETRISILESTLHRIENKLCMENRDYISSLEAIKNELISKLQKPMNNFCVAERKDGKRCSRKASTTSKYCWQHAK